MRRPRLLLSSLLLLPACSGAPYGTLANNEPPTVWPPEQGYDAGSADGGAGTGMTPEAGVDAAVPAPGTLPPIAGAAPATSPVTCANGTAPQAYLMTQGGTLFAFDTGTLETRSLGVPACPAEAGIPVRMSVSPSGVAYVLYQFQQVETGLYRVDLTTLACTKTPYTNAQPGFARTEAAAVSASLGADRLFVYGYGSTPPAAAALGVSDATSFLVLPVGAVSPAPVVGYLDDHDLQFDAFGRMFVFAGDGTLTQLDPATGAGLGRDSTGFDGSSGNYAVMPYGGQLYFFGGDEGAVSRYDLSTKTLSPLGQVNQAIAGASAAPCVAAAPAPEADGGAVDASVPPAPAANPFSPGDAWIGTYSCDYNSGTGLTNVALVVDSVDGDSIVGRFDYVAELQTGSFDVSGTFDPATREATFTAGAWQAQSAGASSPVGMDGFVDLDGHHYAGNISAQGCGAFSVQR